MGVVSILTIRQSLLPVGHRNRPGYPMVPKGLLFHTTNNWSDGAGDEMHGKYMASTDRVVSWHVTVDKDSATQHIPFNENAWHAGDGQSGYYNRHWIGLEIACEAVEYGQHLDRATYENAVDVAAQIMMAHGWESDVYLQPHYVVYGKDCPHHTLFDRERFRQDVISLIKRRKDENRKMDDRLSQLESRIGALESKQSVTVPDWAQEAVDAAVNAGYIDTPDGGSIDFYRMVTVMYRAGLFKNDKGDV